MSESDIYGHFICQIMSGCPGILIQLAKPRNGVYSTRLTSQKMSELLQIIFKCSKVGMGCNKLFHMPNNVRIALNIISIGQTRIRCYSTRLTFETMSEQFQIIVKCSNVGIGCNKLFYMPNNVWMALNNISIG